MRRRIAVTIAGSLALAAALASSAIAQVQSDRADKLLKYRKAVYQVMAWNIGPLAAMAQDKQPFDAAAFTERATRVAGLTPMLAESYGPDARLATGSKLKPEMWSNREDFDTKLQALIDGSARLAKTAADGDPAASKAAFFDMAQTCKACHDKYRAD